VVPAPPIDAASRAPAGTGCAGVDLPLARRAKADDRFPKRLVKDADRKLQK
jgi:hypothetical protein